MGVVHVNGGHEAPVVSGPGGVRTRLHPTGPAVGMLPGLAFAAGRDTLDRIRADLDVDPHAAPFDDLTLVIAQREAR